eukprot:TRINITY_DN17458_c0_g1_i4.p1 TRINITY_DN17458_c0_g1~~TRINITY_DN17458_c0_g1_i4.p1  ORF type:complete len:1187 (+),score=247.63 TRINITY_DN17458_c0_g1_i4:162-3722(+)
MSQDSLPLFSSISASFASFRGGRLSRRVVVVSADEDVREAACWVLQLLGCGRGLGSGPDVEVSELLGRPDGERVDLVLCDIELAGRLLQEINTSAAMASVGGDGCIGGRPIHVPPVVLICGKRMDKKVLNSCLDAGAKGYLTKPLRIQAIRGIVLRHAAGTASEEALGNAGGGDAGAGPEPPPAGEEPGENLVPEERCGSADSCGAQRRYDRVKVLGKGAFGTVHLVRRTRDGACFALKELSTAALSSAEQRRVLDELRLHRAFDCPMVVRYFTSWMQDDVACLLMEYVENGTLSKQVEKAKKAGVDIPDISIVDWAGQILVGLLYLHRKEVVHRDLKLDNVLGPDSRHGVKLADFGISKRLRGSLAKSMVGTPEIMAPERCVSLAMGADEDESEGYGPASDIWSLGVMLYELASLRAPFPDCAAPPEGAGMAAARQRQEELFARIRGEDPPHLPFARAAVLHKLVPGGLLRKRPEERPSASDLCRDPDLGAAIHRFLKRQNLLEHPSILEIIDILPAQMAGSRSRIESSELDIMTLRRSGRDGLASFAGGLSLASTCESSFLDRSRMKPCELEQLPEELASVLSTPATGRDSQGYTKSPQTAGVFETTCKSDEKPRPPPIADTGSTVADVPAEQAELAALEEAVLFARKVQSADSNAEGAQKRRERRRRSKGGEGVGPSAGYYHTHPAEVPSLPGHPLDAEFERLAISPHGQSPGQIEDSTRLEVESIQSSMERHSQRVRGRSKQQGSSDLLRLPLPVPNRRITDRHLGHASSTPSLTPCSSPPTTTAYEWQRQASGLESVGDCGSERGASRSRSRIRLEPLGDSSGGGPSPLGRPTSKPSPLGRPPSGEDAMLSRQLGFSPSAPSCGLGAPGSAGLHPRVLWPTQEAGSPCRAFGVEACSPSRALAAEISPVGGRPASGLGRGGSRRTPSLPSLRLGELPTQQASSRAPTPPSRRRHASASALAPLQSRQQSPASSSRQPRDCRLSLGAVGGGSVPPPVPAAAAASVPSPPTLLSHSAGPSPEQKERAATADRLAEQVQEQRLARSDLGSPPLVPPLLLPPPVPPPPAAPFLQAATPPAPPPVATGTQTSQMRKCRSDVALARADPALMRGPLRGTAGSTGGTETPPAPPPNRRPPSGIAPVSGGRPDPLSRADLATKVLSQSGEDPALPSAPATAWGRPPTPL